MKTEDKGLGAIDPISIVLQFNECITNADLNGLSNLMTEDHTITPKLFDSIVVP